jgi:hypothetical protein
MNKEPYGRASHIFHFELFAIPFEILLTHPNPDPSRDEINPINLTQPLGPPFLFAMLWIPQFLRTSIPLFAILSEFHKVPPIRRLDTIRNARVCFRTVTNMWERGPPNGSRTHSLAIKVNTLSTPTHRIFPVGFDKPAAPECPSQSVAIKPLQSDSRHLLSEMYLSM